MDRAANHRHGRTHAVTHFKPGFGARVVKSTENEPFHAGVAMCGKNRLQPSLLVGGVPPDEGRTDTRGVIAGQRDGLIDLPFAISEGNSAENTHAASGRIGGGGRRDKQGFLGIEREVAAHAGSGEQLVQ